MVLKRNMLSVALMSATMLLVGTANAQEAEKDPKAEDAETLDRVTVKGIRSAIEKAIDTKRDNTSIVESISAEDIGKLPDASIADSIARLPGLTAQRDRGRAQQINIRGLSGDFAATTLNGREQVSLNANRGVEFDQYPSELISAVTVYKTPDASLVGQGLSGTIDMQTVSPLAYGERVVALNYRADQNELDNRKAYGNRYSFSYIDQFADNTVGISLGYAHLDSPGQINLDESWGYSNRGFGANMFDGHKAYQYDNDNVRDGFAATLEFKPNSDFTTKLDVFYSTYKRDEKRRGLEMAFFGAEPDSYTVTNGFVTEFAFDNFSALPAFVVRNDIQSFDDEMLSFGWNNKFQISERWSAFVDISSSSVSRNEIILESKTQPSAASGATPGSAVRNSSGYWDFTFDKDFADPSIILTSNLWGDHGYHKLFKIDDSLFQVRAGAELAFDEGIFSSIEFGFNRTDRDKQKSASEAFLRLNNDGGSQNIQIPSQYLSNGNFSFVGISGILNYNPLTALNDGFYYLQSNSGDFLLSKNWEIDETINTYYIQANINTDLGSVPVRGNVGVQVVSVDQSSTGGTASYGVIGDARTVGATYTDVLPSLNLTFELPAEQYIRTAIARQVARPKMDDMSAQLSYYIDLTTNEWAGNGGNPELKPWLANAFDISYEKYFGGKGYVSAAYFYKDLQSYIYNDISRFDFASFDLSNAPNDIPLPPSTIGNLSQPLNGEGGKLEGYELAVSVPFELMWKPLEGFGIQASYSDTKSNIDARLSCAGCDQIPGLSKYVSNITLYYERYGFATRVSQRKRSDFVGSIQGFGGVFSPELIEGDEVVDFQVSYSFGSGMLENLSVYFQVGNLTDEPFKTNQGGNPNQPNKYLEYGRTTLLGFSYKF
jgi:iron complex outermembrane receptor protein